MGSRLCAGFHPQRRLKILATDIVYGHNVTDGIPTIGEIKTGALKDQLCFLLGTWFPGHNSGKRRVG